MDKKCANSEYYCSDLSPPTFALELLKHVETAHDIELSELAEYSFAKILLSIHPAINVIQPNDRSTYYEVSPDLARLWAVGFHGGGPVAELVRHICSANILNGKPIPDAWRPLTAMLVLGDPSISKSKRRKSWDGFGLFWITVSVTHYISDAYGIKIARNDGSNSHSAADAVSDALQEMCLECSYDKVRDWCQHGKFRENRQRAELIEWVASEGTLLELGLISAGGIQISGIPPLYGPTAMLGRTTETST